MELNDISRDLMSLLALACEYLQIVLRSSLVVRCAWSRFNDEENSIMDITDRTFKMWDH